MLIKSILVISESYEIFGQFVHKMGPCMALTTKSNVDQSTAKDPSVQLILTLQTKNRSFLVVKLNAHESCSPWRKVPPIL